MLTLIQINHPLSLSAQKLPPPGVSETPKVLYPARREKGFSIVWVTLIIVVAILFGIMFWNQLDRAKREKANTMRYNMRQLHKAFVTYSEEHDGYLPSANQWCDLLIKHNETLSRANFRHPRSQGIECSVAFNTNLGDHRLAEMPPKVVLLFEAEGELNLVGTGKLLKKRDRHIFSEVLLINGKLETFRHIEGGIERYDPDQDETSIERLRWEP